MENRSEESSEDDPQAMLAMLQRMRQLGSVGEKTLAELEIQTEKERMSSHFCFFV